MLTACGSNWVSDFNFGSYDFRQGKDFPPKTPLWGISRETFLRREGSLRQMTIAWRKCQLETPTFRSIEGNFVGGGGFKPSFSVGMGWPKRLK
jgi:hypothetical protein